MTHSIHSSVSTDIGSFNPFPGLRPFQANESHLFFGRENYIETIFQKLNAFHFVSIVGNSGSGKSSLMRAGVIPRLKKDASWIIATMRPGMNPVEELNLTLSQIQPLQTGPQSLPALDDSLEILNSSPLGLVQLLRNAIPVDKRMLIIVDQFEELFRFNKENENGAQQFVNLLLHAIQQKDVNINVIITLRSDFIGECEQFMGLPEAINNGQFLIPRMKMEELQLSITGPVELAGQRISPRLVQQLLKDVGSHPDQLPILQHVLMRTWEVWKNLNDATVPIDLVHYEATGKMDKALSNHAEEAMLELKTSRQNEIIAILFKTLTVKESDNRGVRRPTSVTRIAKIANAGIDEVIELVNIFRRADRGFLMPPDNVQINAQSVIDISHESLMRVWDRLGKWVDDEFESAQIYQRLTASALLYEKNLSGLWRDPDLQIALEWNERYSVTPEWAEQYNPHYHLANRFMEASRQNKLFMLAEKNRKRKLTNIITVLVVAALSTLSLWAFRASNNSARNEQLALVEKTNAQEQEKIARKQKQIAEESAQKAEVEKQNAEKQKQLALQKEQEANEQKQNALRASINANQARNLAETEKQKAIQQRFTADSLRKVAITSEKKASRLRILSIAQTLAVKSASVQKGTFDENIKSLLAIQAYAFNKSNGGNPFNPDVYNALYLAHKEVVEEDQYKNNVHTDMVRSVAFSPNEKEVANCGSDGLLLICNVNNLQKVSGIFPKQPAILENLCYHASGNKIACTGDRTEILIFNVLQSTQQPDRITKIHSDKITGLAWKGDQLITIGADQTLKITSPVTKQVLDSIRLLTTPSCLTLSANQQKAYIGFDDGSLVSVTLDEKMRQLELHKLNGKIASLAISSDGNFLAAGMNDGKILLINLNQAASVPKFLNQHKSTVTGLSFDKTGHKLLSSGLDGFVYLWNITNSDPEPIAYKEHDSWVWSVAFHPSGKLFCSAGKDKQVIKYMADDALLVSSLQTKLKRNFTPEEWLYFVGKDIPYEKTVTGLP
ncbi:MAG: hypothetical protein WC760_09495 [Bacteroidia bacterium]|jgi:WD40 repeat protein